MPVSTGLELGASSVRAVTVERQGSRVRMVASAQVPWSGEVGDDLVAALKQLRRAMPLHAPVVLGAPSSAAIIATVTPLIVNRAKADLAIQFELQQQLPYDVSHAIWSSQWLDRRAPQQVVVAAVKDQMVDLYASTCRRGGVPVQQVQINGMAAVNLWARRLGPGDAFEGALLHLDAGLIEWILVRPDGVQVIPVPSNPLTQHPEDVMAALRESWSGVREGLSGEAPGIIWVCGVSLSSPQFLETLARELSCAVDVFDPTNLTGVSALGAHEPHQLVISCGLAFQGIGLARLPLNLLARRQTAQHAVAVRRVVSGVAALGLAAAVGLSASGMLRVQRAKREVLTKLTAQERLYQQLRTEIRQELQRQELLEQRLAQVRNLWAARTLLVDVFQQLGDAMPEEIWLTKLDLVKSQSLTGMLEGYGRSFQAVTAMIDQLKRGEGWTSVKPMSTTIVPDPVSGKELVAFVVQLEHRLSVASAAEAAAPSAAGGAGTGAPAGQKPRMKLKTSKPKRSEP